MNFKLFLFMCLFSASVFADSDEAPLSRPMSSHMYLAEIHKAPGCTLPSNPDYPSPGDCVVVGKSYEIGSRIIQVGGICMEEQKTLIKMHHLENDKVEYFAPEISVSRHQTPCSLMD